MAPARPSKRAAPFKYFIMPNKRKKLSNPNNKCALSLLIIGLLYLASEADSAHQGSKAQTASSIKTTGFKASRDTHRIVRELGQAGELKCCLQMGVHSEPMGNGKGRRAALVGLGSPTGTNWPPVIDETPARTGTGRLGRHLHDEEPEEGEEELARADEAVELILWYRLEGSSGQHLHPIYSLDARQPYAGSLSSSSRKPAQQDNQADQLVPVLVPVENAFPSRQGASAKWADQQQLDYLTPHRLLMNVIQGNVKQYAVANLSQRVRLRVGGEGGDMCTYLIIDQVRSSDAGQYKCRVDYRHLRTSYHLNQLHVIAPVTSLRISAAVSDDLGQQTSGEKANSHPAAGHLLGQKGAHGELQILDVEEGQTIRLECSAQEGWPKARLAWWQLQWSPQQLELPDSIGTTDSRHSHANERAGSGPWLIRLSSLLSESSSSLEVRLGLATGGQLEANTNHSEYKFPSEAAYLINATVVGQPQQQQQQPPTGQTTVNNKSSGPAHVPGQGPTNQPANDELAATLAKRLRWALEAAFPYATTTNNNNHINHSRRPNTDKSEADTDELASLFASQLATLESNTKPQTNTKADWQAKRLLNVSVGSWQHPVGPDEMWQLFCRQRLLVYTCGASNAWPTGSRRDSQLTDLELDSHSSEGMQEPEMVRDKLAKLRPIFRSVLIRPKARPRWIRMFLVNRRVQAGGSERIELSPPLRNGQSIYLNLAVAANEHPRPSASGLAGAEAASVAALDKPLSVEGSTSGGAAEQPRHLQLVCLVEGGSLWARPHIEWVLAGKRSNSSEPNSDNINVDVNEAASSKSGSRLVSGSWGRPDTAHDTEQLIKGALWGSGPVLEQAAKEPCASYTKHWSSFKLHNISVRQHQTSIKCQVAYPRERRGEQAASLNNDRGPEQVMLFTEGELSTSVELNITHVPVLQLKIESQSWPEPLVVEGGEQVNNKKRPDSWPVAYGHNVTLTCQASFANPPLLGPIEWSLNDTELSMFQKPSSQLPVLVNVLSQLGDSHSSTERLIVQFHDAANIGGAIGKPPNGLEAGIRIRILQLQLKCAARNALGRASSQPASLLLGQPPFCLNGLPEFEPEPVHSSDKLASVFSRSPIESASGDKDLAIHCPVISDKNSTTFHWLVPGSSNDGNKQSVSIDTGSANPVSVAQLMQVLNEAADYELTPASHVRRMLQSIQCHARDKFGSNHASRCQTQVVSLLGLPASITEASQKQSLDKDDKTVQGRICTARAVHNEGNKSSWPHDMSTLAESTTQLTPVGSKLTVLIECQAALGITQVGADSRLLFDLYQKTPRQHLKRFLVQPSSNQLNSNWSSWWIELALLDNDSNMTDWPPKPQVLADSYLLAMSLLTGNRDEASSLVATIPFVAGGPLNQQQHQLAGSSRVLLAVSQQNSSWPPSNDKLDHHYEISESGRRRQATDWIVKGLLGVALASSVVLVIGGWLCSKTAHYNGDIKCNPSSTTRDKGHTGSRSQAPDLGNGSEAGSESRQQTSTATMYLVGGQERPNVYHNQAKEDRLMRQQHEQHCESMSMTALAGLPVAGANSVYEHLIVIKHPAAGSTASPVGSVSVSTAHLVADSQGTCSPGVMADQCPHHWQPSADTFLLLEPEPEPELLTELPLNHLRGHVGGLSVATNRQLESTLHGRCPRLADAILRPLQEEQLSHYHQPNMNLRAYEPDRPIAATNCKQLALFAPNRLQNESGSLSYNQLELNSQGELTMTDESSSFIHDDSGYNQTGAICNQQQPYLPGFMNPPTGKSGPINNNQRDECLDCRLAVAHCNGEEDGELIMTQTNGGLSMTSHHHLLSAERSHSSSFSSGLCKRKALASTGKLSLANSELNSKQQSKQVKFLSQVPH